MQLVGKAIFQAIPGWLRDSKIDPPNPEPNENGMGFSKGMAIALRSGIKGLVSPFLPAVYKRFYGQKLEIGRNDTMPIIAALIVNFALRQMYEHPLEFVTDEDTKTIIGFRPYHQPDESLCADERGG